MKKIIIQTKLSKKKALSKEHYNIELTTLNEVKNNIKRQGAVVVRIELTTLNEVKNNISKRLIVD